MIIAGSGLQLEITGLDDAGPEITFVGTCTLCGLELSRRTYDASIEDVGTVAFADSARDSYAALQHVMQHGLAAQR